MRLPWRIAVKNGYIEEDPFKEFPIKETYGNQFYLKDYELNSLIELYREGNMDSERYKTLQLFFFMCFGSQHIGDAKRMTIEQVGDRNFTYIRQKTETRKPKIVTVPISDSFRKILYDIVGNRKKGPVFENLPSEQKMNEWLKKLAAQANINEKVANGISHKAGRHTFATYFLSKTKDLNALKEILGHSNIRETLIYAHVLDSDKQEGIKCFNDFM